MAQFSVQDTPIPLPHPSLSRADSKRVQALRITLLNLISEAPEALEEAKALYSAYHRSKQ